MINLFGGSRTQIGPGYIHQDNDVVGQPRIVGSVLGYATSPAVSPVGSVYGAVPSLAGSVSGGSPSFIDNDAGGEPLGDFSPASDIQVTTDDSARWHSATIA